MTAVDALIIVVSLFSAVFGTAFVGYIVQTSGRDRPIDPQAVQRFIDTAPPWRDTAEGQLVFRSSRLPVQQVPPTEM